MSILGTNRTALCVVLLAGSAVAAQNAPRPEPAAQPQAESQAQAGTNQDAAQVEGQAAEAGEDAPPMATESSAPGMPSFQEVADLMVAFVGGQEKLDSIRSIHAVMEIEFNEQVQTVETRWLSASRAWIVEGTRGDVTNLFGSDGTTPWLRMVDDNYIRMRAPQAAAVAAQAELHINMMDPDRIRRNMETIEVVAKETFAERECFKVRVEPRDEPGLGHIYVDAKTGQVMGIVQTLESPAGVQTSTIMFESWKPVEGVRLFHLMKMESPGGDAEVRFTKIEVNTLEESEFALPEQIAEQLREEAERLAAEEAEEGESPNAAPQDEPADEAADEDAADEISLEDLPESYRDRVSRNVAQVKAGGAESIARSIQQYQEMLSNFPAGNDRLALEYMIQELKKAR